MYTSLGEKPLWCLEWYNANGIFWICTHNLQELDIMPLAQSQWLNTSFWTLPEGSIRKRLWKGLGLRFYVKSTWSEVLLFTSSCANLFIILLLLLPLSLWYCPLGWGLSRLCPLRVSNMSYEPKKKTETLSLSVIETGEEIGRL